jgi:hypothetical protein
MTTETERTALEMARSFLASVEMNTDLLERDRSDVLQAIDAALASAPSAPRSLPLSARVRARLMEMDCRHSAREAGGVVCRRCADAAIDAEAETLDPIAAAVDAHLDPLKDELIAMGHKLAKDGDA